MGRKIAAGATIAMGVALVIIFALGIAGIIPGINAPNPIIGLTCGMIIFLGVGFALAGCKPRNEAYEIADTVGLLGDTMGKLGQMGKTETESKNIR